MPVVAIIDPTPEIRVLLRSVLEEEGWSVITPTIPAFPYHTITARSLFGNSSPNVIVYDLSPPYEAHWKALHQYILPSSHLAPQHWIITTTNPKAITALVSPTTIGTIIGKPFDLDQIIEAIIQVYRK